MLPSKTLEKVTVKVQNVPRTHISKVELLCPALVYYVIVINFCGCFDGKVFLHFNKTYNTKHKKELSSAFFGLIHLVYLPFYYQKCLEISISIFFKVHFCIIYMSLIKARQV